MTGKDLYAHYWDSLYCETGEETDFWDDLTPDQQKGWDRLAQCIREGRGVTMPWPYEPAQLHGDRD